jgi:hypothetical protein
MVSRNRNRLSPFTTRIAGFVALTLATLGGSQLASARPAGERGSVVARGAANKVIAAGPAALHVYAQSSGGSVYTAPAVTGTDRDCSASKGAMTTVRADRVATVSIGAGQVACLATATSGSFELLWHAVGRAAPTKMVIANAGR